MLIAPIFLIMFAAILLLSTFGSAFGSITTGGAIAYDENVFQDFANEQYMMEFGSAADSEDALLLVFLVEDEAYYEYAYIAWCGDHINSRVNSMFGSNGSKFGTAVANSAINSGSYKYSLDSGIAQVVDIMQAHIESLGLESSLTCKTGAGTYQPRLINYTNLDMTEDTVNSALASFTEATGIPVAVVVEDAEEVFPRNFDYTSVIVAIVFIVAAVFFIVNAVKKKDQKENTDDNYNRYA